MKAIIAVWNYFKDMNSEPNGTGVSIKRNISFGIASLVSFVEIYSLCKLQHATKDELDLYMSLCKFYVIVDISFILLALSITSIEKLTDLVQRIKGGIPTKILKDTETESPKEIVNESPKEITNESENQNEIAKNN